MITPAQISYIQNLGMNFDFSNLTSDNRMEIEDKVGDAYTFETMNHPGEVTPTILMCESILDHLDEL